MPDPTVLAFDTSAAHCAAALLSGGRIVATAFEEMPRGQAERLMPMLDGLLASEGAVWAELNAVAVGIGPGNFTGLRVAVAAARGLSLGLGAPAVGVSSFEVLRGLAGLLGPERQIVHLPAPRGGAYLQAFENGRSAGPAHLDDVTPPPHGTAILGPEADELAIRWSNGAPHLYRACPVALDWRAGIEVLARLAAGMLDRDDAPPRPAPLYIRPPDAAPARPAPPVA